MINLDFLDGEEIGWVNSFHCSKMVGIERVSYMGRFMGYKLRLNGFLGVL